MKVLWITNIVFPKAAAKLNGSNTLKSSGGWMLGAAEALINASDIELAVATVSNRVDNLQIIEGKRIRYYLLSSGNKYSGSNTTYNKKFEKQWIIIDTDFKPDIIHIHGTENTHGLAYMRACGSERCVISIQGMMSAYVYYDYGLTKAQILRNLSLFDIIRCNSIFSAKKSFRNRSKYEREMIQRTHHSIAYCNLEKRVSYDDVIKAILAKDS